MKEINTKKILDVYIAIKEAIPEMYTVAEVLRACELIIAEIIVEAGKDKEVPEKDTYAYVAEDIQRMVRALKDEIKPEFSA